MDTKTNIIDRELSWLDFNARVLEEAYEKENPLMERMRFLAITASNLDEFMMVRVAGVMDVAESGRKKLYSSGLTPQELLPMLDKKIRDFVDRQYSCLSRSILPQLEKAGIRFVRVSDLTPEQLVHIDAYFDKVLFPVLTPMAVDRSRPFPRLANKSLNIVVHLREKQENEPKPKKKGKKPTTGKLLRSSRSRRSSPASSSCRRSNWRTGANSAPSSCWKTSSSAIWPPSLSCTKSSAAPSSG